MKYYKELLILFICLLLLSCAGYKAQKQISQLSFPDLGSIVKVSNKLDYKQIEQVGIPSWKQPLEVTVQQLPFNKVSYEAYAATMQRAGKINSIPYVDSLLYKQKYLRLQLLDKIGITSILNSEENMGVKTYLEKDEAFKMVSVIDVTMPESEMPRFQEADAMVLEKDEFNHIYLLLINGNQEERVAFTEFDIFRFEYASFCWGEDRYHKPMIVNLVDKGDKCPRNTFKNASKIEKDKSYVKF